MERKLSFKPYYSCPYCEPDQHKKLEYARLHGDTVKPLYKCVSCKSEFVLTEDFKKTQRWKDKDG